MLCVGGFLNFSHEAQAQWTVIDPSNLVQNIKSAVQSTTTASNMVKSLQESIKIYNQSKAYYDAHNLIKDARKVRLTIEMVSEITNIYVNGFNRMVSDPNFTADELAAISTGYARLLEEGGALVSELKNIVASGNGLSMSDKERMDMVERIYSQMLEYRNLTRYFTRKAISVSYIRSRDKGDMNRILALYGSPNERYW